MDDAEAKSAIKRDRHYSNWMSELPEKLWDVPLCFLAIPGSHDTMSYCLDMNSPLQRSEPFLLKVLDCLMPCFTRPCIYKWGTTQDHCIAEQLEAGVRFFDLRIVHKQCDCSNTLYFAHGIYSVITVQEALKDFADWLKSHPKEVIILNCSHFEGLSHDHHEHLIFFMKNLFGNKICPSSEILRLRNLWSLGYQVIISYDDTESTQEHKELWDPIQYWWADRVEAQGVIQYLEDQKENGRPGDLFVAGLNLTEDTKYIILHPWESMRSLTLKSYSLFLDWIEKQSPGSGRTCLNIFCGDFVGINNFVPIVIDLNRKLVDADMIIRS
ncbi:PI-PLC X domain-containing protein 1-like isoform X1 [Lepisosteus oculatus]|uniref:PI-PLC X domain-containing protein 1-like isoform X1 n=1 Tax=Lepisosteus oculatus TaxID=7918 RepID=UPI0035F52332